MKIRMTVKQLVLQMEAMNYELDQVEWTNPKYNHQN